MYIYVRGNPLFYLNNMNYMRRPLPSKDLVNKVCSGVRTCTLLGRGNQLLILHASIVLLKNVESAHLLVCLYTKIKQRNS